MKDAKLIRGSSIFLVFAIILSCLQYIIGGYYIILKETVNESLINEPLTLGTTMSYTINNNTSGLDFAILGFPKCGTTFLRKVLGYHRDIAMGGRMEDEEHSEFCQIQHNDGVQKTMAWLEHERSLEASSNQQLPKQYGIKCPSIVRKPRAIVNLVKQSNEMRLVLGVRHPVRWFESVYNYRSWYTLQA
jgi:hypothetical protein